MKNHYLILILFCLIFIQQNLYSQDSKNITVNNHSWFVGASTFKIYDKISISGSVHLRRHSWIKTWQQLLYRGGINYKVNNNISVSGAYTYLRFYPYGQFPVLTEKVENRSHIDLIIKDPGKFLNLKHRYRLEQRFMEKYRKVDDEYIKDGFNYSNRFRYKVSMIYLFGNDENYLIELYNDLMIAFGNNVISDLFHQNWIGINTGWKISDNTTIKAGYMHQFLHKYNEVYESNHTLKLKLYYNFDLRKMLSSQ